jgi:hypothetical protein
MRWTWGAIGRDRRIAGWALFALGLAALHGPAVVMHIGYALDPGVFNDDVRQQIFPYFRFSDRELFAEDALGNYILAGSPIGFRALYTSAALVHDAAALSKALPYILLLVTTLAVVSAVSRFASRWSAFASASLVLGGGVFMARMAGGLARGFAFPLLAVGLALLAAGRLRYLLALVPISAGLYPPAAVVLGIASALAALALPAGERGDLAAVPAPRRLALVGGAFLLTVLVALPPVLGLRAYGRMIVPAMVREYPEAGPGGRYGATDRAPFPDIVSQSYQVVAGALRPGGRPLARLITGWLPTGSVELLRVGRRAAVLLVAIPAFLVGCASLARRSAAARRTLVLGVAALVAYPLARLASPYLFLPGRYLAYALPVLVVVLLPAGAAEIPCLVAAALHRRPRAWTTAATALLVVAVFGGTLSRSIGLRRFVPEGDRLFAAIAGLPKNALIAGWPGGPIDTVPYACRRQVFLSWELHQAFHTGYVAEARRRMGALVEAYFAVSPEPLVRLRDEFGVTHLLVHLPHLRGAPPTYFEPFGPWISEALRRADGRELTVLGLVPAQAVYADEQDAIVDLRALGRTSDAVPRREGIPTPAVTPAVSGPPLS